MLTTSPDDFRFLAARHPHAIQLYEDDPALVRDVAAFIGATLHSGSPAIVVGTEEHRTAIATRLESNGTDVDHARHVGRFVELDARDIMRQIVTGTSMDADRFAYVTDRLVGQTTSQLRPGFGTIGLFGEVSALLARERLFDAALDVERHWDALVQRHRFSTLCGYPTEVFGQPGDAAMHAELCAIHTSVITPNGDPALALRPAPRDASNRAWLLPKPRQIDIDTEHDTPPSAQSIAWHLQTIIEKHNLPLRLDIGRDHIVAIASPVPGFHLSIRPETYPVVVSFRGWLPARAEGERWEPLWQLLERWGTPREQMRPMSFGTRFPDLLDHVL